MTIIQHIPYQCARITGIVESNGQFVIVQPKADIVSEAEELEYVEFIPTSPDHRTFPVGDIVKLTFKIAAN